MKIAIMGTGAVGGYFGALLARAGHEVTFVARGAQLQAFRTKGLRIEDARLADGGFTLSPCRATDNPAEVGVVDVILFCVKLYDTESAAEQCRPMLGAHTALITLQNGVDAQDRIAATLGTPWADNVAGGFALVSGVITEPGVMKYTSAMSSLIFGVDKGAAGDAARGKLGVLLQALAQAGNGAGFSASVADDIRSAQWSKFVGLCTNAALSCVVRQPAGITYHTPETVELAKAAFAEVAAVGRAKGLTLPPDIEARALAVHQGFPPGMYASMFHDLRQGRKIELESLSGVVVREGKRLGVATPVHAMCYAVLKLYSDGAPKVSES